jgi:hypothetical protein
MIETECFRIAEALTSVVRHAQAQRDVELHERKATFT